MELCLNQLVGKPSQVELRGETNMQVDQHRLLGLSFFFFLNNSQHSFTHIIPAHPFVASG